MKSTAGYLLFLLWLGIGLAGCGSSNGMKPTPTPIPFFSGLFEIDANSTTDFPVFRLQGNLTQNGNSMSGTMHLAMLSCVPFNTDIPVTGTLSNTPDFRFDLAAVLPGGQNLSFSMTVPKGQSNFLSGPYSFTGAAGCGVPDTGGGLVHTMILTGPWRATFTASGGATSHMSLALTQTGPDSHGFFSATGTGIITGGTCFNSATVDPASLLIGTGSQLVLDNSQPGSSGQTILQGRFAPLAFGGFFFIGTYTSTEGACSESGSVIMNSP